MYCYNIIIGNVSFVCFWPRKAFHTCRRHRLRWLSWKSFDRRRRRRRSRICPRNNIRPEVILRVLRGIVRIYIDDCGSTTADKSSPEIGQSLFTEKTRPRSNDKGCEESCACICLFTRNNRWEHITTTVLVYAIFKNINIKKKKNTNSKQI